jgi:hypothetical protein
VGKTVGFTQTTGVRTADGLFSTSRRAGKLLSVPAKLRCLVAREAEKKRIAALGRDLAHLRGRISELYTRIGERACNSPQVDRSFLSADPELEALASMVRDLQAETRELEQGPPGGAVMPSAPERDESVCAVAQAGPSTGDSPVIDAVPSLVAEEHKEPPTGA